MLPGYWWCVVLQKDNCTALVTDYCVALDTRHKEAYGYFIASLKSSATYAPAFTSLGVYYSEYASPPDLNRASKCFQKAFELDPREGFAARKLAEGFAEDREWDLVEVIARRTIKGEGGTDAGIKGLEAEPAARYLPTNTWAWKALGIVELVSIILSYTQSSPFNSIKKNRRNHPPAIRAFQIALRGEPEDHPSWLRLGEAYSKDGRHGAAMKAFTQAQALCPDDWMCGYLIGDVQRQMGHFEDAIAAFELILEKLPSEVGVWLSLGEAYLSLGRRELSENFQTRAGRSFVSCIRVCLKTIQGSPGFRTLLWKTMADAIFFLSARSMFSDEEDVRSVLAAVTTLLPVRSDNLSAFMQPLSLEDENTLNGIKILEIAAAAYSYRLSLSLSESVAIRGSAWFDLGVALQLWATKSSSRQSEARARVEAVTCFNQALREDPGNVIYWVAMGDAHFLSHAKTAQHAYVKALEIESKVCVVFSLYHNPLYCLLTILKECCRMDKSWIALSPSQ
jgi:superkiller protein 3